jgi:protease II
MYPTKHHYLVNHPHAMSSFWNTSWFSQPQVLAYLKAENEYCQAVMADTAVLQDALFKEMKGRIQEEDCSVPVRDSGFYYYTRTLEGKQYGVHCRRIIPEQEDGEIIDEETMMDETCVRPLRVLATFLNYATLFRTH